MFDPDQFDPALFDPALFDPDLLRRVYRTGDRDALWIRLNFVSSIDGAATVGGLSEGLNDPWDLQVFETLRAMADVVVVAAGTVREEEYDGVYVPDAHVAWRKQQGLPDHPRLAIVTASGDLDPASAPFDVDDRKQRPLVFAAETADPDSLRALQEVAEVVVCGEVSGGVDLQRMAAELAARGLHQVLCEGGPTLFGSLLAADLVDELCLTISPLLVGGRSRRITTSHAEHVHNMGLVNTLRGGAMLFLRYCRTLGPESA